MRLSLSRSTDTKQHRCVADCRYLIAAKSQHIFEKHSIDLIDDGPPLASSECRIQIRPLLFKDSPCGL